MYKSTQHISKVQSYCISLEVFFLFIHRNGCVWGVELLNVHFGEYAACSLWGGGVGAEQEGNAERRAECPSVFRLVRIV